MRSNQINFFIAETDLESIMLYLESHDCVFIRNKIIDINAMYVSSEDEIISSKSVFLSKKIFTNRVFLKYENTHNYYYVDDIFSEVVKFNIGGFYGNNIHEFHRGRLYFVSEYYNNDNSLTIKSTEFILWAKSLFNGFKKSFLTKHKELGSDYLSARMLEWAQVNSARPVEGGLKLRI